MTRGLRPVPAITMIGHQMGLCYLLGPLLSDEATRNAQPSGLVDQP